MEMRLTAGIDEYNLWRALAWIKGEGNFLLNHPLRGADSLQLAAALVWAGKSPHGHNLVCLDQRLREAARKEGYAVLPEEG